MRRVKPEPAALAVISIWEATAIISGRLPTITTLVRPLPRRMRAAIVAGASAWLWVHFQVGRRP